MRRTPRTRRGSFETPHDAAVTDGAAWKWDISPDGQRFLFPVAVDQQVISPLTLITNWQLKLKKQRARPEMRRNGSPKITFPLRS